LNVDVAMFRHEGHGGHGHIFAVPTGEWGAACVKIPAYDRHSSDRWPLLEHKLKREWMVLCEAAGPGLPSGIALHADGQFLARQFVVGEALSRVVRYASLEGRTKLAKAVFLLGRTLFQRLHHHPRGSFLLRDFKPQNIVVPIHSPQALQLVDVGGVLAVAEVNARTWTLERLGTGQWLHWAPEQLLGEAEKIGLGVDYFALGATAYYCLTATSAYPNGSSDRSNAIREYRDTYHSSVLARLAESTSSGLESHIANAIAACLDPDVTTRWATIEQLNNLELSHSLSPSELFGTDYSEAVHSDR